MSEKAILVDENDSVIGESTVREAHEKRLMHRVVHVVVRNSKGEVLMQKRKDIGTWDVSVGGHVDPGESYAQAAKREMRGELGISTPITFAFKFENKPKIHFVSCFTAEYEGPFTPNEESSEIRFMNKKEVAVVIAASNLPSSAAISLKRILNLGD